MAQWNMFIIKGVFGIEIGNGMERQPSKKGKGKDNGCCYLLFGMLMERETPINIALSLHNQYNWNIIYLHRYDDKRKKNYYETSTFYIYINPSKLTIIEEFGIEGVRKANWKFSDLYP